MRPFWCVKFLTITLFLLVVFTSHVLAVTEAEKAYHQAEADLKRFAKSKRIKYRRYWLQIISRFKIVFRRYPESPVAPKALFKIARLYEELYGYSGRKSDLLEALKYYRLLWQRYPQSPEAEKALLRAQTIYEKKLKDPVKALAIKKKLKARVDIHQSQTLKPLKIPSATGHGLVKVKIGGTIKQVRYWSSEDYSRVVLDLTARVRYEAHVLKPMAGKPPRLYVDCSPARLSPYLKPAIPIGDGLLKQIRFGQYRRQVVRVVLDLTSLTHHRVFFLDEPPRLVIDLIGKEKSLPQKACPPPKGILNGDLSLAQQLGLCVRRVVIDPGHGGKDPGCRYRRVKEKEIVLKVSKLVAEKLKKRLGCEVILTRRRDVFLPLEQRTAFANIKRADLFVSIHVNSSPRRRARGIETYYLNFASDEEAMRVAALENAASTRSLSELQDLLKNILLNTKLEESKRLAEAVQKELVSTLRRRYRRVRNRGVKTAPFVVLIGTRMPAILVEIGFLSHPEERRRLQDPRYLDQVAEGIVKGIVSYVKGTKVAAYR